MVSLWGVSSGGRETFLKVTVHNRPLPRGRVCLQKLTLRAVPQGLHHLTWLRRVKNQCKAPALWHCRMASRHSSRASSTAQPNTMPPSTTREPLQDTRGEKMSNVMRYDNFPDDFP